MERGAWSIKVQFALVMAGMLGVMAVLVYGQWRQNGDVWTLWLGGLLMLCAALGAVVQTVLFARRLQRFSDNLCAQLDGMMSGENVAFAGDSEALFDRIVHRLLRMESVQRAERQRLARERQALQSLVSDIAHQVRLPLANVQMIADTLLEQAVSEDERQQFLHTLRAQSEKLDFLLAALVKTSRLETGLVHLEKRRVPLYDTVAQALSGIVTAAQHKKIAVTVDCPENLVVSHDSRWTAEALFNFLDNAVKYTPVGGQVSICVQQWEMYVEVCVADNGSGIPEELQAQVFKRFYRAPSVHDVPGVGIGLYLAREIITRQGGYIRLVSAPGKGAAFSVMLPCDGCKSVTAK